MAARKDPASVVVTFFTEAPLEAAVAVLAICKGIIQRRQPPKAKRKARAAAPPTAAASDATH